mmetsp:Transcript_1964/g.2908  ORF Transcript_1964/g.2908 Transcript_1964/m.2908 type:complete len:345 (+) Transcript_1964:237-1271(+)
MGHQSLSLFLFDLLFLGFSLLLLLNLGHVVLSFNAGLVSQAALLLRELLLASHLQVSLDALALLLLEAFALTGLAFTLFEGSLGSKGVDFGLSVSGLLLKLSEPLDLTLLLVLDALSLELGLVLLLVFGLLVLNDLVFLVLLLLDSLLFFDESLGVGLSSLLHQHVDALALCFSLLSVLSLHLSDVVDQLQAFLVADFLFFHSFDGALLDLVDDDLGSLLAGSMLPLIALFFLLEDLKTFDFHHKVELLLLIHPLVFELFVLLDLLVADGDDLSVEHHLVHVLHVVHFAVQLLLGFRQQGLGLVLFSLLELSGFDFLSPLLVELLHLGFAGLRLSEGHVLLLLS